MRERTPPPPPCVGGSNPDSTPALLPIPPLDCGGSHRAKEARRIFRASGLLGLSEGEVRKIDTDNFI